MKSNPLLELAHPVRMKILRTIAVEPLTLEGTAKHIEATVEETKINLERLANFRFVEKDANGKYHAAPLGHLALSTLADMDFVAQHSDFFQEHELSLLPQELVSRLGELAESERLEGSVSNIQRVERVVERSKGRVWVVTNEVLMDAVPIIRDKISKGIDFRIIIDQTFKPPESFSPSIPDKWRQIPKIPAATVLTGNEALLFFPNRKLDLDTAHAFTSEDPQFMKWCEDLVEILWHEGYGLK